MPNITIAIVAKMFPATRLDNIKANLPHVLSSLEKAELTAEPIVLTALATIRAETESFEPIDEFVSRFNTSPGGTPFHLYDNRRICSAWHSRWHKLQGVVVSAHKRANYEDLDPWSAFPIWLTGPIKPMIRRSPISLRRSLPRRTSHQDGALWRTTSRPLAVS
jgi:hypothetical protein